MPLARLPIAMCAMAVSACATTEAVQPARVQQVPPSFMIARDVPPEPVVPEKKSGKFASTSWKNAAKVIEWEDDKLLPVSAACCGDFTVIHLGPGERHTGKDVSVFGDPDKTKWQVFAKESGPSEVIVVGAVARGQKTKMVVTTSHRTYHFALSSVNKNKDDGIVKFKFPESEKRRSKPAERGRVYDPSLIDNRYLFTVEDGSTPAWMPVSAFNIGSGKTWIEFPAKPGDIGAPLLLASIPGSDKLVPVNIRLDGNFYEVDAAFSLAELSLSGSVVSIKKGVE